MCMCESQNIRRNVNTYLSDFVKTWLLGFRLATDASLLQASAVSKKLEGLPSWSLQLDSPGTAPTVGGWIMPGGTKLVG